MPTPLDPDHEDPAQAGQTVEGLDEIGAGEGAVRPGKGMAGQQLRLPHGGAQAVEPQQDGRVLRRGEKVRLALLALRVVAVLTQTVAVQPKSD